MTDLAGLQEFLARGGPALWAIATLSVLTVALILWKIAALLATGAWVRRGAERLIAEWQAGQEGTHRRARTGATGVRGRVVAAAIAALQALPGEAAREETARVARAELARLRDGLRALELIATIAPLLGLLGTVMGMIEAFQALQQTGARADPAVLAGGIWEALLTTAAGMAVAIPAAAALTWFESVAERVQTDIEDMATRVFLAREGA
ncbi:MotA/TolQ/ExbB proton channel family protein [Rhodosalinus halophilus]|uniref:MotA/TolQ/ExbB proton channel family protein n=1 Tax=Rhodosalinus halophilus TaxID=2259333 RepID=A0A365U4E9_9RHOB|nr:MotA/TolQ/ExbB proton channel family protein [Rhodosalinus halophilus]RBI82594.1 MotA/TolQ/ExbB proton channel family protein [Rhodosalinus halophilus]